MNNNTGTPKNLNQAIENGISDMNTTSIEGFSVDIMHQHIQDYLAQKFTIAYSRAENEKTIEILQSLWDSIIK